jgi:hypothetical protein
MQSLTDVLDLFARQTHANGSLPCGECITHTGSPCDSWRLPENTIGQSVRLNRVFTLFVRELPVTDLYDTLSVSASFFYTLRRRF